MKGISAENWHCVLGWRFFGGDTDSGCQAKMRRITSLDSIHQIMIDWIFWGLKDYELKGWELEFLSPNFYQPSRDGHVQSEFRNSFHYIRY